MGAAPSNQDENIDLMLFAQDNEMNLSWLSVVGHKYQDHNDDDNEHNDDHNDSNDDHNDSNDDHNDANDNYDQNDNAANDEAESAEAAETDETAAADAGAEQSARKRRDNHSSEEHNDSNDDHNDDQNNDHNDDKHNDHNDDKAMDKEWHMKWFDSNNYDYKSENFHFNSEIHYANWFPSEPNGSGNKVFMHADNGKWFDMDGEKWTSSFICVKDTEMVEVVQMEEQHSGVAEVVMSAAAVALLGL